jgi:hypothetical protein
MKNKLIIYAAFLGIIAVVLTATGCKKFLDKTPLTATLTDMKQGLLESESYGLYNVFRTYATFNELIWCDFNSIRDDDAQKGSEASDGAEIATMFETFQYAKSGWAPETNWADHYYLINQANRLLYDADSLNLSDVASLMNKGEAYFFRAYCYFGLVKAYGQVPLINFYFTKASDGIKPKAEIADIYAQIDKDLDSASMLLPINWNDASGKSTYPGRLTSGAAKALWAQTYLFRSNWGRVADLCKQVVLSGQYSLVKNYADIWRDGTNGSGKNSTESIFETQCNSGQNAVSVDAVNNGNNYATMQLPRGSASSGWNAGWGWNTPTKVLNDAWSNTDPRKALTILYANQPDGLGGFGATAPPYPGGAAPPSVDAIGWNKKVYLGADPSMRSYTGFLWNSDGNSGGSWINRRVIRYADVLLMLAEASNELGDGTTAATNLELIRARARNSGSNSAALPAIAFQNKAQMRTAIKNERRWEFAMEGYRFYDLVRWTPASDGIDAPTVLASLGYTPKCQYYPIPTTAIDISGGVLVQNPNW